MRSVLRMHTGKFKIARRPLVALALACAAASGAAHAEIKQAAADGFFLAYSAPLEVTTATAYADLVQVQKWWNGEHTWSGKAANLSLKPEAGGCFCERWPGGSAEHGRVIMALPGKLLRLDTALGPLQEFALKGVLSFWLREDDYGKARIDLEYRVNGASASGLDQFAPQVDDVLGAQFSRLLRFIASGDPEDKTKAKDDPETAVRGQAARAAILEEWKKQAEQQAGHKPAPAGKDAAKPAKPGTDTP